MSEKYGPEDVKKAESMMTDGQKEMTDTRYEGWMATQVKLVEGALSVGRGCQFNSGFGEARVAKEGENPESDEVEFDQEMYGVPEGEEGTNFRNFTEKTFYRGGAKMMLSYLRDKSINFSVLVMPEGNAHFEIKPNPDKNPN